MNATCKLAQYLENSEGLLAKLIWTPILQSNGSASMCDCRLDNVLIL